MTWSKTKIAIVAGVALLLAAATTSVVVKAVDAARTKSALASLAGDWEGTLNIAQTHLRLVVKIFRTNNVYCATLDSVDQGAKDVPFSKLFARPGQFEAELAGIGAVYKAKLSEDGKRLSGSWKQMNQSFRLSLTRTNQATRVQGAMVVDEYAPRPDSDLQGAWEGVLKVGEANLRLGLRIADAGDGTFHAQMDSLDQGARNLPVTSLTYNKPIVHLVMASINGVFEGNLSSKGDELVGSWTQMKKSLPLTFRRVKVDAQAAAEAEKVYTKGAPDQVQGHWKGLLNVNKLSLHIVLNLARMSDGSYTATMDSPDQGAIGLPATLAEFVYPDLRLEWKGIGAVVTAKLKDGKLHASFEQAKTTFPAVFEREPDK